MWGATIPYVHTFVNTDLFQSTLPVWGATCGGASFALIRLHFNPRSPCGERLSGLYFLPLQWYFNPRSPCGERRWPQQGHAEATFISIHAPRVGSDGLPRGGRSPGSSFQSTLPVWGATHLSWIGGAQSQISIHAPRVGSDDLRPGTGPGAGQISIHAPRVGSDAQSLSLLVLLWSISIHAPRVGSDSGADSPAWPRW